MPKIQTRCPNCQQPMAADVHQVLDVGVDPQIKEKLLSGTLNIAQCPSCGFQGQLPLPIVYHDPEKELLLTFYPPSMDKTMEEKESEMGPLIKEVTENLPPEKRKGYLFQPKTMMSMQSMVKTVLEAEGITSEMIEEQQEKMSLLEELLRLQGDAQVKKIQEEDDRIDREFFALFTQIAQRMASSQNQQVLGQIQELQDNLLQESQVGKDIAQESAEIEAARETLQNLGQDLTRGKLLELVKEAPNLARVRALVSLARPAMDYSFLQMFSEQIEAAEGEEREKLVERRNLILQLTQEIDQYLEERAESSREILEALLQADDLEQELIKHASQIDETFLQVLTAELEEAEKQENHERQQKLAELLKFIQELSTPREYRLIDQLIEAADQEDRLDQILEQKEDEINQELMGYLSNLITSVEESLSGLEGQERAQQRELLERIEKVHQKVLKSSMEKSFRKG